MKAKKRGMHKETTRGRQVYMNGRRAHRHRAEAVIEKGGRPPRGSAYKYMYLYMYLYMQIRTYIYIK